MNSVKSKLSPTYLRYGLLADLRPVVLLGESHELGEADRHAGGAALECYLLPVQPQVAVRTLRV
jgi:hypothetical protein